MILTCPNCATRYSAKRDAISSNGRTVRCSACDTTWFISAEDADKLVNEHIKPPPKVAAKPSSNVDPDALALKDNQRNVIEALENANNSKQANAPHQSAKAGRGFNAETLPATSIVTSTLAAEENSPNKGAHVSMRDKADAQKLTRRRKTIFWIWAVPISVLAIAAAIGLFYRQGIVDNTPKAASLYKRLGLQVKQNGLIIESPVVKTTLIEGQTVLLIDAAIKNVSKNTQDLPLIELALRNGAGEELVQWFVEPERPRLGAKGRLEFTSQFPDPPIDTEKLTYRFAN